MQIARTLVRNLNSIFSELESSLPASAKKLGSEILSFEPRVKLAEELRCTFVVKDLYAKFLVKFVATVEEALTTAYWTIKFVISLGTEGVGQGTEAIVLAREGETYTARKLDNNMLLENDGFIAAAEEALRSVPKGDAGEEDDQATAAGEVPTMER